MHVVICDCVCPLMPSCNTYPLTWVSLTLDMGYHFTAAPAKRSCSSFLTLDKGYLLTAASHELERKAAPLSPPTPVQPSFLGLGEHQTTRPAS